MEKIPTAEELYENTFEGLNIEDNENLIPEVMIKFSQMHVQAALEAAKDNIKVAGHSATFMIDEESILNAYPLENIK